MSRVAGILVATSMSFAAVLLPACGGVGGSSNAPGVGTITVTGFAPNPIPSGLPVPFTITGTNFQTITGNTATVRFHATNGTPFGAGTLDTVEVTGNVVSDTSITGTTPVMTVCGAASITLDITVILESGVQASLTGVSVTVTPPTVTSVTVGGGGNIAPALVPTGFTINGTGFAPPGGPFGGTATILLTGDAGAHCFADGTENTVTLFGTITSDTTITATTPVCTNPVTGSGFGALSVGFQGAAVKVTIDSTGSCSLGAGTPGTLQFDRPDGNTSITGTSGPQIALQTIQKPFTITTVAPATNVFAPTGAATCEVTFISTSGTPFEGGTSQTATVPGAFTAGTIVGSTPLAVATANFTCIINIVFESGMVGNGDSGLAVTFVAPPVITSFVNTRPPFQQGVPTSFNTVRALGAISTPVQVNGANFQAGAVADFYDTAVGPTKPIGTGLLTAPVVTAPQITGGSPTDLTLPAGLTNVTVRVTNPDGQVGTNTTPRWSTDDVLANANTSNLAGNNAEMMMAVNPTNNLNAVICSHDLRVLGGQFSPQVLVMNTLNGGVTWSSQTVGSAATAGTGDGFALGFRGDPMCAADAFGNFYIGYLVFEPNFLSLGLFDFHHIVIVRSSDGGVTWTAPTSVVDLLVPIGGNGLDRCGIACGPCLGGGATDQAVYACWHDFSAAATNEIQVGGYRSTGLGAPAAPAPFGVAFAQNGFAPAPGDDFHHPAVAVGPHGELFVAWIERNGNAGTSADWINCDPDGLGSGTFGFGSVNFVTTVFIPNTRAPGVYPTPQLVRGYASEPWMTVIQTGPFAGRLVFAYDDKFFDDGVPGDEVNFGLRVLTRVSDNLGVTWSSAVQAHVLDVRHQFQPAVGTDPITGDVYCTWYDSAADVANNRAVIHFSAVSEDGVAWVNPLRQQQDSSDIAAGTDGNDYLEYCGVAAANGLVYGCWCDFTPGNGEVFASPYQQHP